MNYTEVYELLYTLGYHARGKNHGQRFVDDIFRNYGQTVKTLLDIGCSNGLAVKRFREWGINAYGIDVSEIAIRYGAEKYGARNIVIGSAIDIPFKDKFFDATFSCDMLEHLIPEDVETAIQEIIRVTRKYLFLTIDCDVERNREYLDKAKKEYPDVFKNIKNLHCTVWKRNKWIELFKKYGARQINDMGDLLVFDVKRK